MYLSTVFLIYQLESRGQQTRPSSSGSWLLGDCQGHVRNVVLGVFLVARDRLVVVEELLPVVVFHCLVGDLSLASTGTIGANLGTGKPGTITPDR